MQRMRKELHRQEVNLKLVRREPLPMVQGNKDQLCAAFEQVLGCCGSMLKGKVPIAVKSLFSSKRRQRKHVNSLIPSWLCGSAGGL